MTLPTKVQHPSTVRLMQQFREPELAGFRIGDRVHYSTVDKPALGSRGRVVALTRTKWDVLVTVRSSIDEVVMPELIDHDPS